MQISEFLRACTKHKHLLLILCRLLCKPGCVLNINTWYWFYAGYCVYKGVYYTQGQTWDDGCDKRCRCEDVMKGYYTCNQRLFTTMTSFLSSHQEHSYTSEIFHSFILILKSFNCHFKGFCKGGFQILLNKIYDNITIDLPA